MPRPFFSNTHSKKIEEIIRVNHAGEFGAQKIYQGQIRYTKDPKDKEILLHMLNQEQEHLDYFADKIKNNQSRPTIFIPLWNLGGYLMGAISAKINMKAAMLVTENVEEVIENHYLEQIKYLEASDLENPMLGKIRKFKNDETEHKNIALTDKGNSNNMLFNIIGSAIRIVCKSAIFLSKKL